MKIYKYIFLFNLFYLLGCNNSDNAPRTEATQPNISSDSSNTLEINEIILNKNKLFLDYFDGMTFNSYKILSKYYCDENILTCSLREGILEYYYASISGKLVPEFENSRLISLFLEIDYDMYRMPMNSSGQILYRDPSWFNTEENVNRIINLYKSKYGQPIIEKTDDINIHYETPKFDKVYLKWNQNNKIIILSYIIAKDYNLFQGDIRQKKPSTIKMKQINDLKIEYITQKNLEIKKKRYLYQINKMKEQKIEEIEKTEKIKEKIKNDI